MQWGVHTAGGPMGWGWVRVSLHTWESVQGRARPGRLVTVSPVPQGQGLVHSRCSVNIFERLD